MKYGVIDIGSNSVRLMLSDGKNTLEKFVQTTRLAEGMGEEHMLSISAIERTALAVSFFYDKTKKLGVDKVFAFATAAVRQAKNKAEFLLNVKEKCGLDVEVVSGVDEAVLGCVGALNGNDGGVIDVGGASSEVIVAIKNTVIFSKSINIGAVKVKDACGQEKHLADTYIKKSVVDYGDIPNAKFYAIGGTATSIAAIIQGLEPYDPKKVDGFVVNKHALQDLTDTLYSMTVEERKKLKGLQPERAEIIACGCLILLNIIEKIGVERVVVSEKDNLEGYLNKKLVNL